MTPQKVNNYIIENVVDSEGDDSFAKARRKITRMFKEIKEDLQKQLNESQDNIDKKKT
jgi:hypothetical protein